MRRVSMIVVLALCTLLCVSISTAQQTSTIATTTSTSVPNLIRYSGTLKDAQGAALASTAPVGVTFAIYNQEDGGAAVWQETQNVTPEANGQYSVILGSTTAAGLPNDLFSQQEQRWLGVQVQGEVEQARVLLVSVPYAFKAHEADTLGGLPASAFVQAAPSNAFGRGSTDTGTAVNALVGAGSAGVSPNDLVVNGNVNLSQITYAYQIAGSDVLSISGSTNAFPQWASNVFVGVGAGQSNTSGQDNTFFGWDAAQNNSGGGENTILGADAGVFTTTGSYNTFVGQLAGAANSAGNFNTCVGEGGCGSNAAGNNNTSLGVNAGVDNQNGSYNVFVGVNAGFGQFETAQSYNTFLGMNAGYNSGATKNTFLGYSAGSGTTTGYRNTAAGTDAFRSNTTGIFNACFGDSACFNTVTPTTGNQNTCLGTGACSSTNGLFIDASNNTCVGFAACNNEGDVFNNIEIGNSGPAVETPGNNQILIGTLGTQTDTYIVGINSAVAGTAGSVQTVCVDANGKLWGTAGTCGSSSRRFKDQIASMGESSSKLFQLRPVSFFYKPQYDDGTHAVQYGLIAEEVAKVYPEMAVYDKDGQPSGVKYQLLAPMLLNELQKEHTVVMAQQDELQTQLQQIKAQSQEIDGLKHELQLQNASLQERLSKLESYVAAQTQMKNASNVQPATAASPNGDSQ